MKATLKKILLISLFFSAAVPSVMQAAIEAEDDGIELTKAARDVKLEQVKLLLAGV